MFGRPYSFQSPDAGLVRETMCPVRSKVSGSAVVTVHVTGILACHNVVWMALTVVSEWRVIVLHIVWYAYSGSSQRVSTHCGGCLVYIRRSRAGRPP